jgi:hypothetical protein
MIDTTAIFHKCYFLLRKYENIKNCISSGIRWERVFSTKLASIYLNVNSVELKMTKILVGLEM